MNESRPYRPSNGTEGEIFEAQWCARCERDRAAWESDDWENGCRIPANTYCFEGTDPEYPKEWIIDEQGPRCTAFQKRLTGNEPLPGQLGLFGEG